MNFDDTPEEAAFRIRARDWIAANAPLHLEPELRRAEGTASAAITSEDPVAAARAWQARKAAAGYACPAWPTEYGGAGMSAMERVIWRQEEGVYAQLDALFSVGHGMCGPTLMAWASEEQKRRLVPPIATGEAIWCQLFSEPAAGSDLAGLRTRAVQAEDGSGDWIVNGQKVWTSAAHLAGHALLLARTDPAVPKHKGLTMFFLDMNSPGIEVRPIRQINGGSSFNEVFLTDVRIPDAQRLGRPGEGWKVSLTTLMNERMAIGGAISTGFDALLDLACRLEGPAGPLIADRAVRSRLAAWAVKDSGLRYTAMRAVSAISRGETPGPENSVGKLVAGTMKQEIAMYALDLQGEAGMLSDPAEAEAGGLFQALLLGAPGLRIAGGTDEILRNIIAERVLGLPGDIRVDKDVPFDRIPTGR